MPIINFFKALSLCILCQLVGGATGLFVYYGHDKITHLNIDVYPTLPEDSS